MKFTGLRTATYYSLASIAWTSGSIAAICGAVNRIEESDLPPNFLDWWGKIEWIQNATWWVVPVCAGFSACCVVTLKVMGKPWVWDVVHAHLDSLRNGVFKDQGDEKHRHQATLFRWTPWWKFSASNILRRLCRFTMQPLLIPVERSGSMNQRTSSCFVVSTVGTDSEGIAGLAWARENVAIANNLPEIANIDDVAAIETYAKEANVTVEWVKKRINKGKPLARSLYGIPIRIDGDYWGVIMFDSQDPEGIGPRTAQNEYHRSATTLVKLLKKA